jgi:hypothetical protein
MADFSGFFKKRAKGDFDISEEERKKNIEGIKKRFGEKKKKKKKSKWGFKDGGVVKDEKKGESYSKLKKMMKD